MFSRDPLSIGHRICEALAFSSANSFIRDGADQLASVSRALSSAALLGQELRFLAYWGIGNRATPGDIERQALDFKMHGLSALAKDLDRKWSIEFLITDTHAQLNGKPPGVIESYAAAMEEMFIANGCRAARLTSVLQAADVLSSWRAIVERSCLPDYEWETLRESRKRELIRLSLRHCSRRDPEECAFLYYKSNIFESAILSRIRPGNVFVTYMPLSMAYLLPALPILHVYVGPSRCVKRPWFAE